jgi:hypothetical protein
MQRRHFKQSEIVLSEWLTEEAERLREEAESKPPGLERERLIRQARRAETDAQIGEWLRSSGLQPPK